MWIGGTDRELGHELQSWLGVLVSVGLCEGPWEAERTEAVRLCQRLLSVRKMGVGGRLLG